MHVAILGLGLIGGSVALALRRDPSIQIAAWSPTRAGPQAAFDAGAVDLAPDRIEDALVGADLIVLGAPPLACLGLIDALGGTLRSALPVDATITDVASTKGAIVARATALGLPFVGGHPMAGREASGFGASSDTMFEGRPWVVVPTPSASERDIARVEDLAVACGAQPIRLTADEHDRAVAAISHLPLVISAALVEAVVEVAGEASGGLGDGRRGDWSLARRLAASGWRDMTRLARGDPEMAAGIAATNADALAGRLRDVRDVIDAWLEELDREGGPDSSRLGERFRRARAAADERSDAG